MCEHCNFQFKNELPHHVAKQRYRLRTGTSPIKVLGYCIYCETVLYCYEGSQYLKRRAIKDIVPYDSLNERLNLSRKFFGKPDFNQLHDKGENEMSRKTLYEVKIEGQEEPIYATRLAISKGGQWVMDPIKGDDVITVDASQCEEVKPYTVAITYLGDGNRQYHFFAKEGEVSVGDVVLHPNYSSPMIVKAIDTKSNHANVSLAGAVLRGTPLTVVEND